ncbi:MAG: hypothetical protein ACRDYV_01725, partial [Acidimicrobiia bacterium]
MLEETVRDIDELDQAGPGTVNAAGDRVIDIMLRNVDVPGAAQTFVERYSASQNETTSNNLAFFLGRVAESPTPETANLIYEYLERKPNWNKSRMLNNTLMALDGQLGNGVGWNPPENTPPVLSRFLLHCLDQESDDENDNAESAVHILWMVHQWAEHRGGLRSVFSADERQAFRDKFDEVG